MAGQTHATSISDPGDRVFVIAFSASLLLHLALVIGQVLSLEWFRVLRPTAPVEVFYDYATAQPEARMIQDQLARARRDAVSAPAPSQIGERMQIRVPDRPSLTMDATLLEQLPARGSVVDLADLVNASRGDPVLLSYFGAIRRQIQQTANDPRWGAVDVRGGLVYISFLLRPDGSIGEIRIVGDRSIPSRSLREIALEIVKAAAPFPPFPPSMGAESKTILQPIEFYATADGPSD